MKWLRRSLVSGFVVTVPLVISIAAFVWLFRFVDGFLDPYITQWFGQEIPGLGLVTLLVLLVLVGAFATNVLGQRLFERGQDYLLRLPVFRTVYGPVKQLVAAFSPGNQMGFQRVVLIDDPKRGMMFGFLTKESQIERADRTEELVAVYVPTNHIYFGDIHIYPRDVVMLPDITVQEGVQIFLTGGMALSERLRIESDRLRQTGS